MVKTKRHDICPVICLLKNPWMHKGRYLYHRYVCLFSLRKPNYSWGHRCTTARVVITGYYIKKLYYVNLPNIYVMFFLCQLNRVCWIRPTSINSTKIILVYNSIIEVAMIVGFPSHHMHNTGEMRSCTSTCSLLT